ncbi:MAG: diaminopimelate decarboxylase [Chloroflexia bacterium]|nr:diaminopimelate decarboxylase [Chloroflexia bacterium]
MVWPITAQRDAREALSIGGVSVAELASRYGTPLYIYDEATIRSQCRLYTQSLTQAHPRPRVVYAGKAWLSLALLKIIADEGLSLDVVSAGELYVALEAGFPAERISFHGNNKAPDELKMALDSNIGQIVVDNFYEIDCLEELTANRTEPFPVLLRLNPGIDVHTHDYRKTGIVDSKFGLGIQTGDAACAVERLVNAPGLVLRGYHAHVGSQIFEVEPFVDTVNAIFDFAGEMKERHGVIPDEMSPGGGFGIQYEESDPAAPVEEYIQAIGAAAQMAARRIGIPDPEFTIEPGRSIVGTAGIAVYTVGATKVIPGVRTYVSVDGGMADNIRPALYGAVYSAELVTGRKDEPVELVTIAGKFCESGDVLIDKTTLPQLTAGDLVAVPVVGAYSLAMASNYNMALRPAVVFVSEGETRLVQRRETFQDLVQRDVAQMTGG